MSWYRPRLERSLHWIETLFGKRRDAAIIDVGAGESTLVDDLLVAGFSRLSLLDLSDSALRRVRERLGERGKQVAFHSGDVTRLTIPGAPFALWHDRAVFHFLTAPDDQRRYVEKAAASIVPGGYAIVAAFASDGPRQCSQLAVSNYDAASLAVCFAPAFELIAAERENHITPSGGTQAFQYVILRCK